jgi:hypothetical protein
MRGYKMFKVFPLTKTNITGFFRIDLTTAILTMWPDDKESVMGQYFDAMTGGMNKHNARRNGYMSRNKDLLWSLFLKTEVKGKFHMRSTWDPDPNDPNLPNPPLYDTENEYSFHGMIQTNGVAGNIILKKK